MIEKILSIFNIDNFERAASVFRKNPLAAILVIMSVLLLVSVGMNVYIYKNEMDCERASSIYIQKANETLKEILYLNQQQQSNRSLL